MTFSITGGADASLFTIVGGNQLQFVGAPNFEAPGDAGANNVYDVKVTATDGLNLTVQSLAVTVTDINDKPTDIIWNAVPPKSQNALPDGSPNLIANLATVDPDNTGGSHLFTSKRHSCRRVCGKCGRCRSDNWSRS